MLCILRDLVFFRGLKKILNVCCNILGVGFLFCLLILLECRCRNMFRLFLSILESEVFEDVRFFINLLIFFVNKVV